MNPKEKILVFIDWYLPAVKAGGPVRSLANMIQALHESFDFYVICSDRDLMDAKPFDTITLNQWQKTQFAYVLYTTSESCRIAYYKQVIRTINPKVIYINGIFSFQFSIKPLIASRSFQSIKTIIAPRGMLGKGALEIKANKKNGFLKLMQVFKQYNHVSWHATSEKEKSDIENKIYSNPNVTLVSNFSIIESVKGLKYKNKAELRLVFVSRISKIKNLEFVISLLKQLHNQGFKNITLAIFGPIEEVDYWQKINNSIVDIDNITYKGILSPETLSQYLNQYEVFILPTFHENYGHAIAEALGNGLPVIISDQTPWRNLEASKAGYDIALDNESKFLESLKYFYNLDDVEFKQWQLGAIDLFKKKIDLEKIKKAYIALFS